MDPADVAAVAALKENKLQPVGALPKLLSFISYYCNYIQDFSSLAKPLHDSLWAKECSSHCHTAKGLQKHPKIKSPPLQSNCHQITKLLRMKSTKSS